MVGAAGGHFFDSVSTTCQINMPQTMLGDMPFNGDCCSGVCEHELTPIRNPYLQDSLGCGEFFAGQ
jgi:hypothetical protein